MNRDNKFNVMAIGAHPDDAEFFCGGTLALYALLGHRVTIASFTSGNTGDLHTAPEQLAKIRKSEAHAAAAVIGARYLCADVMDGCVFPDELQRTLMIDLLRDVDPDLIITHNPADYHPDHRYVSQLVFDSYFQKGLPNIPHQSRPACRFGHTQVYFMDNAGGINFLPQEYVDITEVHDTKIQMFRCHQSQFSAHEELANVNILQMMEIQARFRGFASGCRFAEGFCRLDAFQRGLTRRILPDSSDLHKSQETNFVDILKQKVKKPVSITGLR